MKDVKVTTFNVGHGLFNLVTGTKDDGTLYCGIFDCGNKNGKDKCNKKLIEDACVLIKEIRGFTHFDDVIISHQDIDHWGLFLDLIYRLNEITDKKIWCKLVYSDIAFCNDGNILKKIKKFEKRFSQEIFIKCCDISGHIDGTITFNSMVSETSEICDYRIEAIADKLELVCKLGELSSILGDKYRYRCSMRIDGTLNTQWRVESITALIPRIITEMNKITPKITAEKFEKMLNDINGLIIYGYSERQKIFAEAAPAQHGINYLGLGGGSCDVEYEFFKAQCRNFSIKNECYSFLSIKEKDHGGRLIIFEKNILGPKRKSEFTEGSRVHKNATSEIVLFCIDDSSAILFPGDATVHTFSDLRTLLLALWKDKTIQLFLAPHHGSYHTNFAFQDSGAVYPVDSDQQPLKKLLDTFRPNTIHISTIRSCYGHPSESFVNLCKTYCSGEVAEHEVVYCPDGTKIDGSLETKKAIYTTENLGNLVFSYPPPPPPPSIIDNAKASSKLIQLPDSDLFIPYGGFNL